MSSMERYQELSAKKQYIRMSYIRWIG